VTKKNVEPALRIEKEIASHRYQASRSRLTRLFSLLMAGAGHLTKGASVRGIIFMSLFATAAVGLLGTEGILPLPATVGVDQLSRITSWFAGSFALITYAIALWDGAREG
jgi:hypothetical protein